MANILQRNSAKVIVDMYIEQMIVLKIISKNDLIILIS